MVASKWIWYVLSTYQCYIDGRTPVWHSMWEHGGKGLLVYQSVLKSILDTRTLGYMQFEICLVCWVWNCRSNLYCVTRDRGQKLVDSHEHIRTTASGQYYLPETICVDIICARFFCAWILLQVECLTESSWICFGPIFDRARDYEHYVGSLSSIGIRRDEGMTIKALNFVYGSR